MTGDERRALVYALIVTGGLVAIDLALGRSAAISGAYALGAIVAGVLGGFRVALVTAVLAFALAATSGAWNDDVGHVAYWARLFVAFCGGILALGAGRLRDQVAGELGRQQMLSAVADLPEPGASLEDTVARVTGMLVPEWARYAAIDGDLGGERVRLGSRGDAPSGGAEALVVTPLRARGRVLGALTIGDGRGGADDPEFLPVFAGRVALALDNAGLAEELIGVEQRLEAILENLGEAVTVQDRSGRMVFANSAAAELLGAASVEELLATPLADLVDRFQTVTEAGEPLDPARLPGRLVLEGRLAEPLVVRSTNRRTGDERWRQTKATAVRGPRGDVVLAVNVIEDITDRKRAELAQRLLADASSLLASSLDAELTLPQVAALTVPRLADACAISVNGQGDEPASTAVAGDAALADLVAARVADVQETGRPLLIAEAGGGAGSMLVVPMATAERIVGVIGLVSGESGRRFADADAELVQELGRRTATAIETARIYNQLEWVATTLQRTLLPPELPEVPGWRFRSLYLPAGGETAVGGDFYDVFPTAAGWMAVMGDVVGRGPAAASLTAMARYTLKTAGGLVGTPTMGLARLNENLRDRGEMALCTAAVVLLREDTGEASLVCAGHPLPYLVRAGTVQAVGRTGPLLGAFDHGHWLSATVELEPGDVLVLYTDGVLDAQGNGDRFGEQRLESTLAQATSADDAVERIERALREFAGAEQDDDTAVLALQKL